MAEPEIKDSKNKIAVKFIENAAAYALPVFFQQFIIFPVIAKKLGAEANGHFLAVIALNYFIVNLTSAVLVNVRLLKNKDYEAKGLTGDFNIFFAVFCVLNTCVTIGGTIFYSDGKISAPDIILSVIVILLFTYHDYILVQYRTELRFREILINNILLCAGYCIGAVILYYVYPAWQIVFIVPYLITAIYDYRHTDYIKEPIRKTELFAETTKKFFLLFASGALTAVVTYGDRLILYPVMDGTSVSVFSSAQLVGKMLQMISTPVSSFLLAYLVKSKADKLHFRFSYILAGAGCAVILYFGCLIISKPLIGILYPGWAEESLKYVPYTAANGVIHITNVIINVAVLRFCHSRIQVIKSAVYLVTYMTFSFVLLKYYGLAGFCFGNIIASVSEFILLILSVILNNKNRLKKRSKKTNG